MDEDMGKTDTTGKKNYKQTLLGLPQCRENGKFGSNYFIRSPPVKTTATLGTITSQVDSLFLSLGHNVESWVEDLVRNHCSQKHQHTPSKQRILDKTFVEF